MGFRMGFISFRSRPDDGSIFIIEKTRQISLNEILSARKTLVDLKNQTIDFETVIAQLKEFGIVYSEM